MYRTIVALILMILPQGVLAQEIKLPQGLGELSTMPAATTLGEDDGLPFDLSGFIESRIGSRLQNDPYEKQTSIGETRLQIGIEKDFNNLTANLVTDFIYDPVQDNYALNLQTGQGFVDIREANLVFSPFSFMDVKIGRQILTWGTGDLLFINDLFPKDWNSFFVGRDNDYLKAPSDAIKTAFFFGDYNLDVVYTPRFNADRFIDGTRISFFDRAHGHLSGRNNPVIAARPDKWFRDDEVALRFYRSFGAYETALYYYNGFWKSPAGQNRTTGQALFPKLQVFGASVRGPLYRGIASAEVGYYKSAAGAATNPLVRNDEFRFLAGYEQEIAPQFTASVQYYLERKLDYRQYLASLPAAAIVDSRNRHVFTLRLRKLLMNQDMTVGLFNFYSPTDRDGYLRLNISYKITDNLKISAGGNIFYGTRIFSFFGQLKNNSNIFTALHYDF